VSWKTVALGEVCDLQNGYAFKSTDYVESSSTCNIRMSNIRQGGVFDEFHNEKYLPDSFATQYKDYLLKDDDLIIAMTDLATETKILGLPTLVKNSSGRNFLLNQRVGKLCKFSNEICVPFLRYFLTSPSVIEYYKSKGAGGLQINISKKDILSVKIKIPPLAEQQRIVAKLDAVFAEIDEAVMSTESKLNVLEELFKGYVARQFEHKDNQEIKKLKEVCEKITDGTHQTPKYFDDGYIFLSSKNVTSRKIDWDNIKYVDDIQHNEMQRRLSPQLGDVLLAKNGTTGVAAMVDRDVKFNIYVSLACLRTKGDVLPAYLLHFVNSKVAREQFSIRTKGIGVPNLHLQEIREVEISFPASHSEQELVIRKIESFRDNYSLINELLKVKVKSLQLLKSSILTQALQPPPQQ
jgi:type I restriction enzyme S subunit